MVKGMNEADRYFFDTKAPHCEVTDFHFTTRHGTSIKVYVIKPKSLTAGVKYPAYFYAHGGGGITQGADNSNDYLCATALNLDCIVFNVDYSLGPEVKAPVSHEEFVDAMFHVIDNADKFNIDTKMLCYAGISGGGWIVAGASNILAKANKSHLFKACFVHTGMLSDETYDKPQEELDEIEWKMGKYLSSAYKLHAKNFEQ